MFPTWLNFLKRSPRVGDRKDPIMSEPTESPPADVARQIAQLTDAVNRLVQAQQAQPAPQPAPGEADVADIGGALSGGHAPRAAVDVAKLSPLQQITLGLRDVKPVGPARPAVAHATAAVSDDSSPEGSD